MNKQYIAGFIVLGAVIAILGGDLALVMLYGYDYSVSAFMGWVGKAFPVVPLLVGIVLGHFFFPMRDK